MFESISNFFSGLWGSVIALKNRIIGTPIRMQASNLEKTVTKKIKHQAKLAKKNSREHLSLHDEKRKLEEQNLKNEGILDNIGRYRCELNRLRSILENPENYVNPNEEIQALLNSRPDIHRYMELPQEQREAKVRILQQEDSRLDELAGAVSDEIFSAEESIRKLAVLIERNELTGKLIMHETMDQIEEYSSSAERLSRKLSPYKKGNGDVARRLSETQDSIQVTNQYDAVRTGQNASVDSPRQKVPWSSTADFYLQSVKSPRRVKAIIEEQALELGEKAAKQAEMSALDKVWLSIKTYMDYLKKNDFEEIENAKKKTRAIRRAKKHRDNVVENAENLRAQFNIMSSPPKSPRLNKDSPITPRKLTPRTSDQKIVNYLDILIENSNPDNHKLNSSFCVSAKYLMRLLKAKERRLKEEFDKTYGVSSDSPTRRASA